MIAAAFVTGACAEEDRGHTVLGRGGSFARAEPLAEELSFAFKAGYYGEEQIWLRGAEGALARVTTWDTDPRYGDTCLYGWSTLGYFGDSFGRFGWLHFDPSGAYLLFTEHLACNSPGDRNPSRVLAYELASGTTRVLAETSVRPSIVTGGETTIVVVSLLDGGVELFELVDGALEPIEVPAGDRALRFSNARVLPWSDRILLWVGGIPALEKVDGRWQASDVADALVGLDIRAAATSPGGDRLCAKTRRLGPEDGPEYVGWVLGPDGEWQSAKLNERGAAGVDCFFAPDETTVAFNSHFFRLVSEGMVPAPFEVSSRTWITGTWRGDLYGTDEEDRRVVRFDWATLDAETVVASEALPPLCEAAGSDLGGTPRLILPPDDRPLALLRLDCGCIDCNVSGSLTWRGELGDVDTIEEVFGAHDVFGAAWLPDGGAAVLSTQSEGGRPRGDAEQRPDPASFFLISPDGAIETIGPLPGIDGTLHTPVSYPASLSSRF